jgi:hypothetical protein
MRALTTQEQRTVRWAAIGIGIYLVLFCGYQIWASLGKHSAAYQQLVAEAGSLRQELKPYDDRVLVAQKMMGDFHLDPAKLTRATVVGEASEQLQKTAASSGIQVGSIRESPAKTSAKELATLQFEGAGPIPAVMGLLKRMDTLGYPLLIDSVQVTPDPMRPNQIKIILTVVILDFEQWKVEDKPHA